MLAERGADAGLGEVREGCGNWPGDVPVPTGPGAQTGTPQPPSSLESSWSRWRSDRPGLGGERPGERAMRQGRRRDEEGEGERRLVQTNLEQTNQQTNLDQTGQGLRGGNMRKDRKTERKRQRQRD